MRARLTPRRLALIGLLFVGLGYATMIQSFSWNQTSHYALIRSIDHGHATIDAYQNETGDKAFYHGHWFSARAPGLALLSLPFYEGLVGVGAPQWAQSSPAQRNQDEMIWAVGLFGNVLPGLILILPVWRLAERFAPGFGAIAAAAIGLGTLLLPFSTLLFSHVLTAALAFAAFVLLVHERDGPPRLWRVAGAGLLMGYAISSEYPLFFAGLLLGLYVLSRPDARGLRQVLVRAAIFGGAIAVGIVPLLIYNHYAFGSWTHLAYADIPRQKAGFFGIGSPSLPTLGTLLFDSRGLITLAPVLVCACAGLVLLYRQARRAEAITIAAIAVLYLTYNSGYYLPFGGGAPGPRFLITILPFLGLPLALAFRRFPAPTIALAAASIVTMASATATHPLTGYERETVIWARYLAQGFFQPTIASAYGAGRGWLAISPFFAAIAIAIAFVVAATPRMVLGVRALATGVVALGAWAAFAAFGPTVLGIDAKALATIVAINSKARRLHFATQPLYHLVAIAVVASMLSLAGAWALRRDRAAGGGQGSSRGPRGGGEVTRGRSPAPAP